MSIIIPQHTHLRYNKDMNKTTPLIPIYDGRVLVNKNSLKDPVLMSVLADMAERDFKALEAPVGRWYISDRH